MSAVMIVSVEWLRAVRRVLARLFALIEGGRISISVIAKPRLLLIIIVKSVTRLGTRKKDGLIILVANPQLKLLAI